MKTQFPLLALACLALFARAQAQTIISGTDLGGGTLQYDINFNGNGNTAAGGNWDSAPLRNSDGSLASELTPTANPQAIILSNSGGDFTLTLSGTFGFWLGANDPADPVDNSAWYYTTGSNPTAPTFTIGGLTAGDTVSLWATYGWDGAPKAPQIDFNGLGNVNINTAPENIGTNPGTASLVQVATGVAATGNSLSGVLNFPSSGNLEGQLGAFIIQITPVPEPSAFVLFGLGLGGLFCLRRRF